jgi:hypothetical protein
VQCPQTLQTIAAFFFYVFKVIFPNAPRETLLKFFIILLTDFSSGVALADGNDMD